VSSPERGPDAAGGTSTARRSPGPQAPSPSMTSAEEDPAEAMRRTSEYANGLPIESNVTRLRPAVEHRRDKGPLDETSFLGGPALPRDRTAEATGSCRSAPPWYRGGQGLTRPAGAPGRPPPPY